MPSDDVTAAIQDLMERAKEFGRDAEEKFQQVMDMIEDFFGKGNDDGA